MEIIPAAIQDVPITPHPIWPWLIALAAGFCYGILGHRKSNSGVLWAISGAIGALVVAMLASGLAHGISVPYTGAVRNHWQIIAFLFSLVIIALPGVASGIALLRGQKSPPGQ